MIMELKNLCAFSVNVEAETTTREKFLIRTTMPIDNSNSEMWRLKE